MSYLNLKNYNLKFFINLIFFIFTVLILIINLDILERDHLSYLIFSIIFMISVLLIINYKLLFFEIFFLTFLWLGFWFKFSLGNIFNILSCSGYPKCGDYTMYQNALNLSSLVMITIITLIILRKKIFKKFTDYFELEITNKIQSNFLLILTLISLIFFSFLCIYNFKKIIYIRGIVSSVEINLFFKYSLQWFILYGVFILCSFLLNFNVKKNCKLLIWIFLIYLILITHISILSRSMILISVVFLISSFSINNDSKKFIFKKNNFIIIFIVLLISILSSNVTNELRNIKFNEIYKSYKDLNNKKNISKNNELIVKKKIRNENEKIIFAGFEDLIIKRWVGFGELLVVTNSKKLGFQIFKDALLEKKQDNKYKNNFFEKNFLKNKGSENYQKSKSENLILRGNTLPGIVAFLYYTGNLFFTLLALSLIYIFCVFIEIASKSFSGNNKHFVAIISFFCAYRLVSFGHAPLDTYQFLLSILFSIFTIYFLNLIFRKL